MTFDEYQERSKRTINNELTYNQGIHHALFGMAGEVGEIHSLYQKRFQGHDFTKENIYEEVGDLLWFIAEYCTMNGISMGDVAKRNIEKLAIRYSEKFTEKESLERVDHAKQ